MRPRTLLLVALAAATLGGCGHSAASSNTSAAPTMPGAPAPTTTMATTATAAPPIAAVQASQDAPTGTTSAAPRGEPTPIAVVVTDPDSVTDAALQAMSTYDTRIDHSRTDAARRAAPLLTDSYAAAVRQPSPGGTGADWTALAAHDGYTTATVTRVTQDGAPPDTATAASRVRQVTITSHGRSGWSAPAQTITYYVDLARPDARAPWRVQGVTVH